MQTCGKCKWWKDPEPYSYTALGNDIVGKCRRFPPTAISIQGCVYALGRYPQVFPDNPACGEYTVIVTQSFKE